MIHFELIILLNLLIIFVVYGMKCSEPRNSSHGYKPHYFTNRGYNSESSISKDIFDINNYFGKHSNVSVLDYGCGSGLALLQLQSLFPNNNYFGVNKYGYGNEQAENPNDLLNVAKHFKIKIHCDKLTQNYSLPKIFLTQGLGKDIPFYGQKFDLIMSQHVFNMGKIEHDDSHIWLNFLIPMLVTSVESKMILLLNKLSFAPKYNFNDSRIFTFKTWEYYELQEDAYIKVELYVEYLYFSHSWELYQPFLIAIVTKCPKQPCSDILILNKTNNFPLLSKSFEESYNIHLLHPNHNSKIYDEINYSVKYLKNLITQLDSKVEKK